MTADQASQNRIAFAEKPCPAYEGASKYDHEEDTCPEGLCDGNMKVWALAGLRKACPCLGVADGINHWYEIGGCRRCRVHFVHEGREEESCFNCQGRGEVADVTLETLWRGLNDDGWYVDIGWWGHGGTCVAIIRKPLPPSTSEVLDYGRKGQEPICALMHATGAYLDAQGWDATVREREA